ncbi:HesA/MoeB/ThiF family protein [Granulicella arctica]|uniref:HesA/MoeB/ThiF family protein n=1 Tax=Granulicella arctica TaxID=940613 RepID=UPI0021DF5FAE|nr:ThiF family adenylyltransferase [Granulicella arctica]
MTTETIHIGADLEEDRYSRFRLIPWWDQEKIRTARILVIGAGALGNEILKNLALLGFQHIVVTDLDRIEVTNLSRAILFSNESIGHFKADVVAAAYEKLLPEAAVTPIVANILHTLGLGVFLWSDLILAGLDNREARLFINRAAWKVNRPWIDGAIEGINGVARVFLPGQPPCYECTLGATDWALLEKRMSCNLLLHEADTAGKVPTTPTISSIIAGIQTQEALKLVHALPTLAGQGFVFEGLNHSSYKVDYTESPDCQSHYTFDRLIKLKQESSELTLSQLLSIAQHDLNTTEAAIDFSREIIHKLVCPHCHAEESVFKPVGSLTYQQGRCPIDNTPRIVQTLSGFQGQSELADLTLNQLGLPLYDIFTARSTEEGRDDEIAYLIAGDASSVLGQNAEAA